VEGLWGLKQRLERVRTALPRAGASARELTQPFPGRESGVYWTTVASVDAFDQWQALRGLTPDTGFWPVLLGAPDYARWDARRTERAAAGPFAAGHLQEAETRFAGDWFVRRHTQRPAFMRPEGADWHERWPDGVRPREAFRPIPAHEPEQAMGLFPTTEGWRCPAYWNWWVANADLTPVDHCCVLRHWAARYGAEPVMMAGEAVLQLRVARPPRDRRTAMQLAVEHYLYCTDRVDQGTGTLERLAAELLDAPVWYFWFD